MRRYSLFLFCTILPLLLSSTGLTQSINASGFHQTMWNSPERCKLCHRTSSSKSFAFRQIASLSELCLSCHGNGTGANTDVEHGLFEGSGDAFGNDALGILNGGAFKSMLQGSSNVQASSSHRLGINTATPGNNATNKKMRLSCISCHDPHVNQNYRWQRTASGNAKVLSNEDKFATKAYKSSFTSPKYRSGQTQVCVGCHDAYDAQSMPVGQQIRSFDAGDGRGFLTRHHHPIQVPLSSYAPKLLSSTLPLDQSRGFNVDNGPDDQLQCLTCHRAHGTISVMSGFAASVEPAKSSSLLRLDNRDVCQDCHKL